MDISVECSSIVFQARPAMGFSGTKTKSIPEDFLAEQVFYEKSKGNIERCIEDMRSLIFKV